ncbi:MULTISPECIES: TetR/AcrR family transcriptional regulator [unclassified Streptomyces]|uniref:TetR/AcrR family transcriptional regulator n=1 Tax=unclassified Streptomyces TaxID=2593676 RepID=UPI002E37C35F|nr:MULTISPECIES: TetR/AcrR family transcriptional regulator [unclassified Streptomyces]WUC68133.1 TetR/AcrR family transcriptional regulator [Streptomyces sp. NBC_00539]
MSDAAATTTPRERYRQQVRAEIKARAREQIAAAGTSALSLNGIAKHMGLSGAALYRYFTGRDELLTELVRDAYQSLVGSFRAAAARKERDLTTLAHALRTWALDDPQRYFLVYGPPVPRYRGPADVTAMASEIMSIVLDVCATTAMGGGTARSAEARPTDRAHALAADPASASALRLAGSFWTRLHGILSLELSGHFAGMGLDPALLYEAELDLLRLAERISHPPAGPATLCTHR